MMLNRRTGRDWRSCWSPSWNRACHPPTVSPGCRVSESCPGTATAWTRSPAARACRPWPAMLTSLALRGPSQTPPTWMLYWSPSSACATSCSAALWHRCWQQRPA
uniref:Macaca fascicularis brain cDNA clone: QflA-20308, similar to human likely ortholog of mouse synembryn (RIC-8), mRNA, RefSeq: NM_021932.4 n=1 Tax=Macaca fascicularis TaxID=9541 RepID=I7G6J0_MACFA|nr:unnamed protein product [Macaca fascicularis]